MAKPKKAPARTGRTWKPKTKTPKRMRKGIYAAAHLSVPVVRLQTHGFDVVDEEKVPRIAGFRAPYEHKTAMRAAFEATPLPADGIRNPLVKRIVRVMNRSTARSGSGWKVKRKEGRRGRGRKGAVPGVSG